MVPVLAFSLGLSAMGQFVPDNVLQHRVTANRLTAGEAGKVSLELSVREGFKIAKRPAPVLQLTPIPNFEVKTPILFAEARAGKDPEYYGELKPLDISIQTGKDVEFGQYTLEGKLTYIYCSEKDKYCSRSVGNIKVPIVVVKK
jgi:hypothetical protein